MIYKTIFLNLIFFIIKFSLVAILTIFFLLIYSIFLLLLASASGTAPTAAKILPNITIIFFSHAFILLYILSNQVLILDIFLFRVVIIIALYSYVTITIKVSFNTIAKFV